MPTLSFDQHQFAGRNPFPVSAESCIAFSDYASMHVEQHKLAPNRKLDAPVWAYNETHFRELLVCYLEARAFGGSYWRNPREEGNQRERLDRACAKIREQVPRKIETLRALCRRYTGLKQEPMADAERLRSYEIEIQNLDTEIGMSSRIAEIVVAVRFYYWRCGLDSVNIAERLHLKSPGVRQILWRLARCWERMQQPPAPRQRKTKEKPG